MKFGVRGRAVAYGSAGYATNRRDGNSECTSPKPLAQGPLLDSRLLRLAMRKSRACSALVSMPSNRVRAAAIPNALVQGSFHLNKEDHLKKIVPFIISGASLFLMAIYVPIFGQSQTQPASAQVAPLTDFQKEAIASIREITLQLILIAIGVFAVVGGFATAKDRTFMRKWLLNIAFLLLGASVVSGLLAYGNLIWGLGQSKFEVFGEIANLAAAQWICFAFGGILFMVAMLSNVTKR